MVNQFEVGEMIRKEQKCSLHADYQVTLACGGDDGNSHCPSLSFTGF